jgi:hypothetical protein
VALGHLLTLNNSATCFSFQLCASPSFLNFARYSFKLTPATSLFILVHTANC